MVLTLRVGGAVNDRAPGGPARGDPRRGAAGPGRDAGSQALEFAMVLPLLGLVIALLVQTGLLLADVVTVQGIAREIARTAVVEGEGSAREVGQRLAGNRQLRLRFTRDDELLEARAELRSTAFGTLGRDLWVPARATMRMEAGWSGDGGA